MHFLYTRHCSKRHVYALAHVVLTQPFVIGILLLFPFYRQGTLSSFVQGHMTTRWGNCAPPGSSLWLKSKLFMYLALKAPAEPASVSPYTFTSVTPHFSGRVPPSPGVSFLCLFIPLPRCSPRLPSTLHRFLFTLQDPVLLPAS